MKNMIVFNNNNMIAIINNMTVFVVDYCCFHASNMKHEKLNI